MYFASAATPTQQESQPIPHIIVVPTKNTIFAFFHLLFHCQCTVFPFCTPPLFDNLFVFPLFLPNIGYTGSRQSRVHKNGELFMMYRIDLSHFTESQREKILKELQPYTWEIYDVSYIPPIIDVLWTSEKSIKELFPYLIPYLTVQ